MNDTRQRPKTSQKPFWKRILERHKLKEHFLRARVPLVLFRFWSPGDSRPNRTRLQPPIAQHPLAIHLQLFWSQWPAGVFGSSTKIETPTLRRSVIKELKHVLPNPQRTDTAATLRSNTMARPSVEAGPKPDGIAHERQESLRSVSTLPVGSTRPVFAGGERSWRANLQNKHPHALRDKSTNIPAAFRLLTDTLLTKRHHSVFAERDVLALPLALVAAQAKRGQRVSAGRTPSLPLETAAVRQGVSQADRVTSALRGNVEAIPDISTLVKSLLVHPAQTGEDGQDSLGSARSRLYAQSAWLNLANPLAYSAAEQLQSREQSSPAPPRASVLAAPPPLDMARLSEEVYRHIQRKIRIERERRGL